MRFLFYIFHKSIIGSLFSISRADKFAYAQAHVNNTELSNIRHAIQMTKMLRS